MTCTERTGTTKRITKEEKKLLQKKTNRESAEQKGTAKVE
jgi:hypothetical protein